MKALSFHSRWCSRFRPGVFGSFLLLKTMGLANDIYAQIGLIMLVGLLGKNAVLIVEFAVQRHHQGATVLEARHRRSESSLQANPHDVIRIYRRFDSTGYGYWTGCYW